MNSPTLPHSRHARSEILRVVIWSLVGIALASAVFLIFLTDPARSQERGGRQKAQVTALFTQAIADREVTDVAEGKFVVSQRHAGDGTWIVRYTNTAGQEAGYFASQGIERGKAWEFKELVPAPGSPRKVFYREGIMAP